MPNRHAPRLHGGELRNRTPDPEGHPGFRDQFLATRGALHTTCGRPGNRTPLAGFGDQPDPRSPPVLRVTARLRSGTFAFTARRAEPLHHGHHVRVEAGGVAPSSRAYHARALLLSYTSVGQGGWICPSGLRFPKPALIYPSSTLMPLRLCALVWNRTSTSWTSARRHHQIGYEGIVVAGVVPGHGHRRLFGFHRARSLRNKAVRGRGFEPR